MVYKVRALGCGISNGGLKELRGAVIESSLYLFPFEGFFGVKNKEDDLGGEE